MTNEERIKADAEAYAEKENSAYVNDYNGYIEGATAENSRAQVLVDALGEVAKLASIWPQHGLAPLWVINAIEKKLTSALEQWKGRGVEDGIH